jgi:D-alanyl-D-alanine carboxypeptidase/D-alanyl-D-alanine-endopeptidase (penicillin-binding protein 4)
MKRQLAFFVAVVALWTTAAPAGAFVPDKTPRRLLEASVRSEIADSAARTATPGVVVMRGDRTVLSINEAVPLAPASLLKLATTSVAMKLFGPSHRFTTKVVAAARPLRGVVAGSLTLVGGGDPTLATAQYRADRFIGRPTPEDPHPIPVFPSGSPTIEDLASRVAAAGVRRVAGDLVVDDTLFDAVRTQAGWLPDYTQPVPETGFIDALTIDEGFTDYLGHGILRAPAMTAAQFLRSALAARGVVVTGAVRAGVAPARAVALASVSSPPLAEIISFTNRWSVNFDAELLLKGLGAAFGGGGTTSAGVAVVARTLREMGIPTEGLQQYDGSGLSLLDRIEPRTIAAILRMILAWPGAAGDAMRSSLPIAGEPGTLFTRMRNTPAAGNLRGKTGSLRGVRAMAGWVTPLDGVPIVYVLIFNDVGRPSLLTSPLDFLGVLFTKYPDP